MKGRQWKKNLPLGLRFILGVNDKRGKEEKEGEGEMVGGGGTLALAQCLTERSNNPLRLKLKSLITDSEKYYIMYLSLAENVSNSGEATGRGRGGMCVAKGCNGECEQRADQVTGHKGQKRGPRGSGRKTRKRKTRGYGRGPVTSSRVHIRGG